jgi:CheY-like chemotaxis protein
LLAGRKLLLADDSLTIQKVIELTFADEGVRVVAFGNGDEALQNLEELAPDIVLADVFMPGTNGYELCEHIKQNERLKHIPVMLLVGSFEPFDEAEARRVGADDTLTKPFQSIRRLIDKVGALVGGRPPEEEVPTAELPKGEEQAADVDRLNTDELAITTADTQKLPPEWKTTGAYVEPAFAAASRTGEQRMETSAPEIQPKTQFDSDSLLDLGEMEAVDVSSGDDDFVLDLDAEGHTGVGSGMPYRQPSARAFVEPEITRTDSSEVASQYQYASQADRDPYADTMEVTPVYEPSSETYREPSAYDTGEYVAPGPVNVAAESVDSDVRPAVSPSSTGQLSPEMIDAIARRVVQMMSEKVVQEIAWEVVPDMAELLIKRQLEEKESQAK